MAARQSVYAEYLLDTSTQRAEQVKQKPSEIKVMLHVHNTLNCKAAWDNRKHLYDKHFTESCDSHSAHAEPKRTNRKCGGEKERNESGSGLP